MSNDLFFFSWKFYCFKKHVVFSEKAVVYASVAQWIRHRPPKPGIAGSTPVGGVNSAYFVVTTKAICVNNWVSGTFIRQMVLEKENLNYNHFFSWTSIVLRNMKSFLRKLVAYASVAQWIRHRPPKPGIAGSTPVGGVNSVYFAVTTKAISVNNWVSGTFIRQMVLEKENLNYNHFFSWTSIVLRNMKSFLRKLKRMPPWPNGYGIGLLSRGLGVRLPSEVSILCILP